MGWNDRYGTFRVKDLIVGDLYQIKVWVTGDFTVSVDCENAHVTPPRTITSSRRSISLGIISICVFLGFVLVLGGWYMYKSHKLKSEEQDSRNRSLIAESNNENDANLEIHIADGAQELHIAQWSKIGNRYSRSAIAESNNKNDAKLQIHIPEGAKEFHIANDSKNIVLTGPPTYDDIVQNKEVYDIPAVGSSASDMGDAPPTYAVTTGIQRNIIADENKANDGANANKAALGVVLMCTGSMVIVLAVILCL